MFIFSAFKNVYRLLYFYKVIRYDNVVLTRFKVFINKKKLKSFKFKLGQYAVKNFVQLLL